MSAINKNMKVADVFESYPVTQPIFNKFGFSALTNPILRNTLGRLTTIEKVCNFHHVNLEDFVRCLNDALTGNFSDDKNNKNQTHPNDGQSLSAESLSTDDLILINNILNMNIQTIVAHVPRVRKVFEKYFGPGCFSSPAFETENVSFACSMHNADPIAFAKECWEVIQEGKNNSVPISGRCK